MNTQIVRGFLQKNRDLAYNGLDYQLISSDT